MQLSEHARTTIVAKLQDGFVEATEYTFDPRLLDVDLKTQHSSSSATAVASEFTKYLTVTMEISKCDKKYADMVSAMVKRFNGMVNPQKEEDRMDNLLCLLLPQFDGTRELICD